MAGTTTEAGKTAKAVLKIDEMFERMKLGYTKEFYTIKAGIGDSSFVLETSTEQEATAICLSLVMHGFSEGNIVVRRNIRCGMRCKR